MENKFLAICKEDLEKRGIKEVDFVFVSGDAYVDHASFAAALLCRLLEANGYTVGLLAQPDFKSAESFKEFGRPKLAFLVSGGAMDSMVSNYTANNKPRSEDAYSHGGIAGRRPDRAIIKYTAKIREAYKGVAVIIGGIEASLRRFSHYDYWSNTVKRSILLDSKADLLMYGMGEHAILEIAEKLREGIPVRQIRGVRGTCWYTGKEEELPPYAQALKDKEENKDNNTIANKALMLPPYAEISKDTAECKDLFARSYLVQEENTDAINAHTLIEAAESRYVVQEPPSLPLTTKEFDAIYELPFTRRWHPSYDKNAENGKKGIPALEEVKFSLTSCRGCFGACSFCAITFHQGRRIQSRSHQSLLKEAALMTEDPDFKGYIHDVGGPTANFRHDACELQAKRGACPKRDCLGTNPCPNVKVDHTDYIELLRKLKSLPKVKKVFIRSGIRLRQNLPLRTLQRPHLRSAKSSPGTRKRFSSYAHEEKLPLPLRRIQQRIRKGKQRTWQKAVPCPLLYMRTSRSRVKRSNRSCPLPKKDRLCPRPGTGFLPNTGKPFHLHVLDRT